MMRGGFLIGLAVLALLAPAVLAWWLMAPPPPPERPVLVLETATFADLPGWTDDPLAEALPALLSSCQRLLRRPDETALRYAGTVGDWRAPCAAMAALDPTDGAALRRLIEDRFEPVAARGAAADGLFTGYYEPEIAVSTTPDETYKIPVLGRPGDLVEVDLGRFKPELKGERIAGRVVDGRLIPYDERAAIAAGSLAGKVPVLYWAASAIDAFFLEIQGSGQARLPDGTIRRIGYAAQNGWPYVAIGRVMVKDGLLQPGTVTLQSIKAWLLDHPAQAQQVMNRNPSYVFFRDLGAASGPIGAQGAALTARRSIAVDRRFHPLGVPIFVDTTLPPATPDQAPPSFRHLMVAQDTGGAIRGPVRGDVFFGAGAAAEQSAGAMKQPGRWWLLLPKAVAARLDGETRIQP